MTEVATAWDEARAWHGRRTTDSSTWPPERLLELKQAGGHRISVVVPARDEAHLVGGVVRLVRRDLVERLPLVDELVVIDSDSTDATADVAATAGAQVFASSAVAPELGTHPGKGEALWKSLFVTTGDLLVFIDADLRHWGTHFVTGLLGPMLSDPGTLLVKGFYDRILAEGGRAHSTEGGRVTELVARPVLSLWWPQLAAVVQPLAGEWAIRRALLETLPVPTAYGIEIATLIDTFERHGLDAIAQVDLGSRAHEHQHVHDLGLMAAELLAVVDRRRGHAGALASAALHQPVREDGSPAWRSRQIPLAERPPAVTVPAARRTSREGR
ncbi:MAG TPA: glucosyl-3-phosphoglycerate synthase [Intrasporangium sp.]|uniref:glucosyl-3-phosphoglycerate synthase n=1 Tax=Intrasporangium sp. TaxID=1925024 RepID=UPI002D78E616|nr:glucosyl-3-phosphoglycerate synthase [Intrasporangium sp.]HET7398636.1 glucosyl-3-phosphoglycerate synthase [Intrasporangium sp.]